jgi:hypothetical protein
MTSLLITLFPKHFRLNFFALLLGNAPHTIFCTHKGYGISGAMYRPHHQGFPSQHLFLPLDFNAKLMQGAVVLWRRWTPADKVDIRRHVEEATLQLPNFFVHLNVVPSSLSEQPLERYLELMNVSLSTPRSPNAITAGLEHGVS